MRPPLILITSLTLLLAGCADAPLAPSGSATRAETAVNSPAITYFEEVALGSEYGAAVMAVRRWTEPLRVVVHGNATSADSATLRAVADDVERILGRRWIELVEEAGNVELWFAPPESFPAIEPNYVPGNHGFVWVRWNGAGIIERARVLVASEGVTPRERAHLIREELTHALGLLRDSPRYRESIFYNGWTDTTEYAEIDELLIRMLYRPEVRPGMGQSEVVATLQRLLSQL